MRVVEWAGVALLITGLGLTFLHQIRVLQEEAEVAAVQSTLGMLRTAFVLDHLQRQAAQPSRAVVTVQRNPFYLLQSRPANYWGETNQLDTALVPPGNWVFEGVCGCVGYLPLNATDFDSPSGSTVAWYNVEGGQGLLQLTAKERYVWRGQVLN
jgi:hypothetical protein